MEEMRPSDAILVENFDPHYLVFERTAALHKTGLAAGVLDSLQMPRVILRDLILCLKALRS